jgi:hypothetical protein
VDVGPVIAVRLAVQIKMQDGIFAFFLEIQFNTLKLMKKYIKIRVAFSVLKKCRNVRSDAATSC